MPLLERDVVVGGGREVGALLLRRARGHELVAAVAVAAAAEELDALGDDLHGLALPRAVGRFPPAPVEPAVDADGAALREVLRAALGLVAEDGDVEVVRLVDPGSRLVAPAAVHCYAHAANRSTAWGMPQLGVLRQVAYENDAVDVRHVLLLFLAGFRLELLFRASVLRLAVFRNSRFGRCRFGRCRYGRRRFGGHRHSRGRVVARRGRARPADVAGAQVG